MYFYLIKNIKFNTYEIKSAPVFKKLYLYNLYKMNDT